MSESLAFIPEIVYDMFRREETIMKTLIDTPSRQTKAAIAAFVRCVPEALVTRSRNGHPIALAGGCAR